MSYKGGGGTISQQSWSELSKCVTAYNCGKVVGRALVMGPPAPELALQGLLLLLLAPVTLQTPGGRKAAVSFHMALSPGKQASPAAAKLLSCSNQPHNGGASTDWWRVTGVWELICLPHLTP